MVEALGRWIPMNQREVLPIVIRVAFDACGTGRPRARIGGMEPLVSVQFIGDLAMALHAAKGRRLGRYLVALDAISGSVQVLMRSGEWARRDLRIGNPAGRPERYPGQANRETPCQNPARQSEPGALPG